MDARKGFSLLELVIVIAILSVLAAISSLAWQRYVLNANLKSAARDIASDIYNLKEKAKAESTNYLMTINSGNNNYTICTTTDCLNCTGATSTKSPKEFSNDIFISNIGFPGNNICVYTRGTADLGTLELKNSRSSRVTIHVNITGKTYVTFDEML